ncbi:MULTISPECIES: molecular chaperone HtpG [Atopobiaceae]|uniref:Chaperone protein HtpG n=1 Tax=Parafannyhessea umbonata TaxID=604330 RepID=A0A1H6I806_9ACTN|nr:MULTISPECIES: molecular chaperone HtpG [Atopobiaceae]SEH42517.1 molecular chaperone HtpG [Parafannyhessea umbonata]SJZ56645.1 molecular chaperone HtpG [Olsenella sp. KH1P3]
MKQFKTESKKLLDLMINSIYTNKEIFLRELISNASDALDKLSFESLTQKDVNVEGELAVRLAFDKDARTISVSDNGIGMTEAELDKNLGTIAHSGSEQFKEENSDHQGEDVDIIGQFGVGFYSSFMVADKVRVVSRAYGEDVAHAWESDGVKGYTIEEVAADQLPEDLSGEGAHGTVITLYLRPSTDEDDTDQYLSEWKLRELVKQYSNYVRYPVQMMVQKSRELPKPEDAGDDYKPQYESYEELETINSMTPIWKKRSSDVEQKDYNEFYKSTFHEWSDPARTVSFHAEGALSYDALLFIPSEAPFDLYSKDYEKGLALYTSNVLIQERCADLLPDYYNFVRGIVDSPDVTLNISRETLQQNSQLRAIARRVEKKIHSELESMRDNDREAYEKFFDNFGRGLKFGIYSSYGSKASDLADLLLFWSARKQKMVTLKEYAAAMADGQDKVYYAAGDDRERLSKMPIVKTALDHGYDVLLCTQDVDEFMFQFMRSYHVDAVAGDSENKGTDARDVEFANVSAADLDLATDEEKKEAEEASEKNKDLFEQMAKDLGDKVSSVKVAAQLGDAPARISSEGPVSLEMERVLEQGPDAGKAPKAQRVLELNAAHPVFGKLVAAKDAGDENRLKLYGDILYNQALLVEGMPIDDPVEFAREVSELM